MSICYGRRRSDSWTIRLLGYTAIMALAYVVYLRFMPVITDFQITEQVPVSNGIQISGTMNKTRHCIFQSLSVTTPTKGINHRLWFEFTDVKGAPEENRQSRIAGLQSWGPWTIFLDGSEQTYDLSVMHKCEWGVYVPTVLVQNQSTKQVKYEHTSN